VSNNKGSVRRRVVRRASAGVVYAECGHVTVRLYEPGDYVFCRACASNDEPLTEVGRLAKAEAGRTE
jgi:hypothetical protein